MSCRSRHSVSSRTSAPPSAACRRRGASPLGSARRGGGAPAGGACTGRGGGSGAPAGAQCPLVRTGRVAGRPTGRVSVGGRAGCTCGPDSPDCHSGGSP